MEELKEKKLYNYSYNINVNYWADMFDDGQINTNEFLVVPIALNDEVKEALNKLQTRKVDTAVIEKVMQVQKLVKECTD